MNNNFGIILLFSVFVTGLIINSSAFAEEITVNATDTIDMTESSNSTSTETTDMTESSNSTSTGDDIMVIDDEIMITKNEMTETIPSPLKQIKEGIVPENIVCKEGLGLVFKLDGQPACVKTTSIEKLIAWGWTQ